MAGGGITLALVALHAIKMRGVRVDQCEGVFCRNCSAKLAMQIGDGHIVDQSWIMIGAIKADAVHRRTGVMHQIGIEAHIARHAHGRLDTDIGEEPCHYEALNPCASQLLFQRGSDEAAICAFRNRDVAGRDLHPL